MYKKLIVRFTVFEHEILGAFTKLLKATISFFLSVPLSVSLYVRIEELCSPRNKFSLNLIFEYISKIRWEISSSIKMWHG